MDGWIKDAVSSTETHFIDDGHNLCPYPQLYHVMNEC